MRPLRKLSAKAVEKMNAPGRYGDGGGLVLQISKWKTKAWLFRYMRDGRAVQMGLGPFPDVSLEEAREHASEARKLLRNGGDPLAAKREARVAQKLADARSISFGKCAADYIAQHRAGWKNEKHTAQWEATLTGEDAATAAINAMPIAEIDTALVLKVLRPIWLEKPETASRIRGRIERVLSWATVAGYRTGDNPARWQGHLKEMLPSKTKLRTVRHHPALPYAEMPAFMADLRARESISARALEFAILTAARTGEVIGARPGEFDLTERVWTVPAERMKAGKAHRVPLSDRAVDIVRNLPKIVGSEEYVFPGALKGRPLSNMAMLELLRGMRPGYVPHGFRSTFRDWAAERTSFPREVAEMSLAHTIPNAVEAAYRRGDLFAKRQRLMRDWATYCERKNIGADVVSLQQAVAR